MAQEFNAQASIDQMAKDLGMGSVPEPKMMVSEEELRQAGVEVRPASEVKMSTANPNLTVGTTGTPASFQDSHTTDHSYQQTSQTVQTDENIRLGIARPIEDFSERMRQIDEEVERANQPANTTEVINGGTKPTSAEERFNNIFERITVDLDNIEVVDANPLNQFKNFNFVMNKKSKTQIVALQSGYVAYVEGYNYDEINALLNSTLDDYALQLLLTQTIFKSINSTSAGQMNFDDWTARTSYYDLDSFIYGNYLETFPGTTTFRVRCGKCGKEIDAKVNNDTLISAENDNTKELLQTILNNRNNPEETMSKAIIRTTKKVFLDDSKTIVAFKLPTIKKHLDLLSEINPTAKEKNKHILTMMLFLEDIYMIDVEATMAAGSPKYNKITDRDEISRILKNLTYNDAKKFTDGINELITRYSVQYQISSFPCSACGGDIGNIPVDMETLLFFRMNQ